MLEKMRANPQDWTIENVETLCRQVGLTCMAPRGGGSHFRVSSQYLQGILTIPAHRPIKRPYIMNLIGLADTHLQMAGKTSESKNGK